LNVLGVTLARGGSKKIKNKNIVDINGKPLIYYTIKEALKSKYLSNYIVSTDSPRIAKIAETYKAEVPFLRPQNISSDKSSSASALRHALHFSEKYYKKNFDYVIEIMNTNPLKEKKDIDAIIKIITKNKCDSVIAINQLFDHHPARIKKILNNRIVDFGVKEKLESRRQDLKPNAYIRSGSIYAMSRKFVIKGIRYKSNVSVPYIIPNNRVINIDEPIDLEIAKIIMKKNEKKK
jgi:CMP-N,N'-diacetyllegionaminic acid synthase